MGRYKKREMPGVTARALLREAGFADVASRDTPPPIALYTPTITIAPPITISDTDIAKMREVVREMFVDVLANSSKDVLKPGIVW